MVAGGVHGDGRVDGLEQGAGVDTRQDEAGLVEGFGALGGSPNTNRREGVPHRSEERAFLGQRPGVGDHRKRVHLQAVIVVKTQGFVPDHARVEHEAGGLQPLPGAGVAGVQNGHIILLRHRVDRVEQREEVLLRVDVLLAVGAQQDVSTLFEAQAGVDVGRLDLRQVLVQDLRHRRAGDVGALLRKPALGQVSARVLGVREIDIGDDVDNPPVRLLRQALVLAAVAGLHVEDRDMQPFRADDRQARVRIPQHQHGIGLHLHHQLVALRDDVAHGLAQVHAHGVHVHIRVVELQVLEEHAVQVVVIILPRVRQQAVEIPAALVDDRRQPDDLRPRPHDDQKLELPVILEFCHIYFTGSK